METRYFLGIDPGLSGGIALLPETIGADPFIYPMGETEHDISETLWEYAGCIRLAAIEKVHSFPGQGVSSTFRFGQCYGFLRGLIVALSIPFVEVIPKRWQKEMGCLSGGDKRVTKAKAQQLYPSFSRQITHKKADALLIVHWLRNREIGR